MIDFQLLEKLWASARDKNAGKPLNGVCSLHRPRGRCSRDCMRNCRLFKINDSHWRVDLHGNTIARIVQLSGGDASVTIESVDTWPSVTTGNRLSGILGVSVWKHDNKLRADLHNIRHPTAPGESKLSYRQYPPLVSGQTFHITPQGTYCTNPEVVTESRTRVNAERAKPVSAYLRGVKALGVTLAKVGCISYTDLPPFPLTTMDLRIDKPVDVPLLMPVFSAGAHIRKPIWYLRRLTGEGGAIPSNDAVEFLTIGLRKYRDLLYSRHGVYETYTYSFAQHFVEVPYAYSYPRAA